MSLCLSVVFLLVVFMFICVCYILLYFVNVNYAFNVCPYCFILVFVYIVLFDIPICSSQEILAFAAHDGHSADAALAVECQTLRACNSTLRA